MVGVHYKFIELEQKDEMLKAEWHCLQTASSNKTFWHSFISLLVFYSVNMYSAISRLCTVLGAESRESYSNREARALEEEARGMQGWGETS